MKITKTQLRQIIKEELMNEIGQVSDIDMEDLALVYDEEFGPDYVIGIMASEFPALDQNEAAFEKALGMFKIAAQRGEEDYPLNFLAKRFAELMNKMGGLEEALPPHLQKHFRKDGSSVHGPEIKDVTPAGYGPDDAEMDNQVTADDFNQISTGLRNLQRGVAREQRDEVMAVRKQLIALRKRVLGE